MTTTLENLRKATGAYMHGDCTGRELAADLSRVFKSADDVLLCHLALALQAYRTPEEKAANAARVSAAAARGKRSGDVINGDLHCGDEVVDPADVRHIGRIEGINSGVAKVKWIETGYFSFVPVEKLQKASKVSVGQIADALGVKT